MQYFMSFSSTTIYLVSLVSLPLGYSMLVSSTLENSHKIMVIERVTVNVLNPTSWFGLLLKKLT